MWLRWIVLFTTLCAMTIHAQNAWREFKAEDGSFTCRVPGGWNSRTIPAGGSTVYLLEQMQGGQGRILFGSGPTTAATVEQLAEQAVVLVTRELLPGSRPSGRPQYSQANGLQAGELRYSLPMNGTTYQFLHLFAMNDGQYLALLSGGTEEATAREMFRSMKLTPPASGTAAGGDIARLLAGKWTFYQQGHVTHGSVSKQIVLYPNGRFEYQATSYVPGVELPTGVDPTTNVTGTYKIIGSGTIQSRADNGQVGTYSFQLLQNGQVLKLGGDLFIRER